MTYMHFGVRSLADIEIVVDRLMSSCLFSESIGILNSYLDSHNFRYIRCMHPRQQNSYAVCTAQKKLTTTLRMDIDRTWMINELKVLVFRL